MSTKLSLTLTLPPPTANNFTFWINAVPMPLDQPFYKLIGGSFKLDQVSKINTFKSRANYSQLLLLRDQDLLSIRELELRGRPCNTVRSFFPHQFLPTYYTTRATLPLVCVCARCSQGVIALWRYPQGVT